MGGALGGGGYLAHHLLLLLPLLVVGEVVEDGGGVFVGGDDLQHLLGLLQGDLLRVPRVGDRLVVVVLQADVPQLAVGHVLHKQPVDVELALPLVLGPDAGAGAVVHGRAHLGHAAEVPAAVHAEQQVHRALGGHGAEGAVQPLVAVLRAAPDGVLDGAVDVVLGVALDDEDAAGAQVPVKVLWVVAVRRPQLLQHGVGLRASRPHPQTPGSHPRGAAPARRAGASASSVDGPSLPVTQVTVAGGDPAGLRGRGLGVVLVGVVEGRGLVGRALQGELLLGQGLW